MPVIPARPSVCTWPSKAWPAERPGEALRISAEVPPLPDLEPGKAAERDEAAEEPKLIELLQISFTKAYAAHFTIFGGHFMSVNISRLFRRPLNYWIDLRYVDPMPARTFDVDHPTLWVSATLGLLSVISLMIAWLSDYTFLWLSIAVPLVCGAVISALIMAQRSKYRTVFCSRYGRIPWFEFLIAKPRRRAVDDFIKVLTSAILKFSNSRGDNPEGRLGAELREHRRLMDRGVLSEQLYNSVKTRLLKQHK